MAHRDWAEWHRDYDDPGTLLSRRGELVQGHPRAELERAPAGDVRLISLCAGQGRDVIGVPTPQAHATMSSVGSCAVSYLLARFHSRPFTAGRALGGPCGQGSF
jgi:hypothetical protein